MDSTIVSDRAGLRYARRDSEAEMVGEGKSGREAQTSPDCQLDSSDKVTS